RSRTSATVAGFRDRRAVSYCKSPHSLHLRAGMRAALNELRVALSEDLVSLLGQHVSPINARVITERALGVLRDPARLAPGERDKLAAKVQSTAQLFLDNSQLPELTAGLSRLLEQYGNAAPIARKIPVRSEGDIRVARLAARDVCLRMGASNLIVQRVATAVS